ncbi:hypothetical protein G6F40_014030 [Rhizopus arrhizus]|nr:hypothetical protein G6F40_014030 [Rhizopus arrhizus]
MRLKRRWPPSTRFRPLRPRGGRAGTAGAGGGAQLGAVLRRFDPVQAGRHRAAGRRAGGGIPRRSRPAAHRECRVPGRVLRSTAARRGAGNRAARGRVRCSAAHWTGSSAGCAAAALHR